MKKLMLFLALALAAVLFVAPAFAEVQNVKVGGDVNVRTISRRAFDLNTSDNNTSIPASRGNPDVGFVGVAQPLGAVGGVGLATNERNYAIMSTVGVDVSADLTDNVGVDIRLINQRDWGADTTGAFMTAAAGNRNTVALDLASVTLKEFFYQPLSLVIGRQDLWFGKGLIVGSTLLAHPELNAAAGFVRGNNSSSDVDPNDAILADEFSELTAFDAVRGTFDLNPWTIDVIYSIINNQPGTNDTYLYGANVGYKFDSYNAEMEGYYFSKYDRNILPSALNDANTIGLRGSLEPIANMNLWGEGALQFGTYSPGVMGPVVGTITTGPTRHRKAAAWNVGADYTWKDISWVPKLGGEFIYYSGEEPGNGGTYSAWDQMYRGKFDTLIREYQGGAGIHYGGNPVAANLYDTDDANDQPSFTNQMQFAGTGAVKLMDALNISLKGTYFRLPKAYIVGGNKYLGWEFDSNLTYDYTEDVQFGLLTGWFFPGKFNSGMIQSGGIGNANSMASEVLTTMKVDF